MERRIPVYAVAGVVFVIIIIFIGGITLFASNTIGRTVVDQSNAQQLQSVTSISQQIEAYFGSLNIEIISLAQKTEIKGTSTGGYDAAITVIGETVADRPEVISVTRYNFRGEPRYVWERNASDSPQSLTNIVNRLRNEETANYPLEIPEELKALAQSSTDNRRAVEFDTQIQYVPSRGSYIVIAAVNPTEQSTEFIVYEIDLQEAVASRVNFVVNDILETETGQLWVVDLDANNQTIFQARDQDVRPVLNNFGEIFVITLNDPVNRSYTLDDAEYESSVASTAAFNHQLLFIISQETDEARSVVSDDLNLILGISVGATLFILVVGGVFTTRLVGETRRRHEEAGLRRTSRALLEVSRALNATLDLDTVLNRILLELQNLIPYYSASILLLSEDGLTVAAHRGKDEVSHEKGVFSIDEARAAREVINTGRPVIIEDTSKNDLWTPMPGSEIRSWLGLPLRVFDRYAGVLNINSEIIERFSPQDIEVAETLADQASVALQNARRHEAEVKRIEQELTVAKGIQNSLLPTKESIPQIPQLEIAFESVAARQVSGDFFQIIELANGYLGVVVGDVTGKGMPAALIMAVITTALRDEITRHRDPGELLNVLNGRLLDRLLQNQMNGALITAIFNPRTRDLAIANAGMVQPYIWLPEEDAWDWIDVGGYPLGASQHANYRSKVIHFAENGLLVMFSDGIIEAQNSGGEFYGFERLEALLEALPSKITANEIKERILKAVSDHLGDEVNQDDVTLMVIRSVPNAEIKEPVMSPKNEEATVADKILPSVTENVAVKSVAPEPSLVDNKVNQHDTEKEHVYPEVPSKTEDRQTPTIIPSPALHSSSREVYVMPRDNVELFIPSTLGYEKVARNAAAAIAREMGFSDDRVNDLMTAVAEACMNAIEHGNQEDKSTSVTVVLSSTDERLDIRVEDRGRQTIPDPLPPPGGTDKSRGWGIFFIQTLMDEVEISKLPEGGNVVKMTIYLGTEEEDEDDDDDMPTSSTAKSESKTPSADASEWEDQSDE